MLEKKNVKTTCMIEIRELHERKTQTKVNSMVYDDDNNIIVRLCTVKGKYSCSFVCQLEIIWKGLRSA